MDKAGTDIDAVHGDPQPTAPCLLTMGFLAVFVGEVEQQTVMIREFTLSFMPASFRRRGARVRF
ncbi:hypothetical protein [Streptomyces phytohabitans]|uniref:hypothetical protein n=1 Tax=Streptomyces phytohabitans TaxID=1150371 RepID=UPI00345BA788